MQRITLAKGDGIGPEIMEAVLHIITAAGVELEYDEIEIGEQAFLAGNSSGIPPSAWDTIRRNKVFFKAPITTPQGGGYKSLNVTTRKALNLFANVRPCCSFHPHVATKHPKLDIVVVRENEEDLYAGIEHQQTPEVVQCLKLISRPGCERIIRYAFEYARQHARQKVTCFTKANIMKQTDGLFRKVFEEIAPEYPDLIADHMIIDIGTARLADTPEHFDVIVVPNLYGDIISDVVAQITGSVGLAGSANIGIECAMFEAIHGSAPDITGMGIANPSGLLQGAILMLNYLGETKAAALIQNAWLKTLEQGIHTADIFNEGRSKQQVNTQTFANAVISNLGKTPKDLPLATEAIQTSIKLPDYQRKEMQKDLLGVDVFVDWPGLDPNQLAQKLLAIENDTLKLSMITNRGIKVWPNGFEETFCTDHWRCRYESTTDERPLSKKEVVALLMRADDHSIDTIKTENLYAFDGQPAFSLGQGQ